MTSEKPTTQKPSTKTKVHYVDEIETVKTAVAKTDEIKSVVEVKSVVEPISFEEDSGMGIEEADKSSFAIPFLTVLQALSPQIETVDGSKQGMIINTITNELWKGEEGVKVIPVAFQRRYLRWSPRSSGGGFKGELNPMDVETGRVPGLSSHNGVFLMDVPEGVTTVFDGDGRPLYDHLADTRNHFVLFQNGSGSWRPAMVSLASTNIKKSKRWMSRIQGVELVNSQGKRYNPPSFSHIYSMKTTKEKNNKGSWYSAEFDSVSVVEDVQLYADAKAFHQQIIAGNVEVSPPSGSQPRQGEEFDENEKF